AVEQAVVGTDVARRRFLVVERAQALHRIGAAAFESHILAHHVFDPDALPNGGDIASWYSSGHGNESRPAGTVPGPSTLCANSPLVHSCAATRSSRLSV